MDKDNVPAPLEGRKSVRLLVTNAFGLRNKFGDFQHALTKYSVDIAVVTETKITMDKFNVADSSLPGYCTPFRLDRDEHGGGVAVWVRNNIPSMEVTDISSGGHELLWIALRTHSGTNILLGAVYRPGSASPADTSLIQHLDETLSQQLPYNNVIIAGDFNVHNEEWLGSSKTTLAGEALEDVCTIHDLVQHVHEPTRGNAILDLVMSNFHGSVESHSASPLGKSDHSVVLCDFPCDDIRGEEPARRTIWRYNKADWNRMRADLRKTDWSSVITDDPEQSCEGVTSVVRDAMKRYIPSKSFVSSPTDPAWWTPECAAMMAAKERHWKRLRKDPQNVGLRREFKDSVAEAVIVLTRSRKAKEEKLREKLSSRSMRDKEWWTSLKAAAGEGRSSEIPLLVEESGESRVSSTEKAEAFGDFFSRKCSLGDDDLNRQELEVPASDIPLLTHIHFRPAEVKRLLASLDVSKATGPDGISSRVLRECAAELSKPLSALFSLCFRLGVQPVSWKTANVVPVHKRASRSKLRNYRPVSLLCVISKVMESIINRQVMNHLESNAIITDHQFGFRRRIGTSDALCVLHHQWSECIGRGGASRVLAVDIAGAFDKVSHTGVLYKSEVCGLAGPLLKWLTSYLTDRSLRCVVGGKTSSLYPIRAGVPQGSILGPSLFLIYVNDAPESLLPGSDLEAFADDTTLYATITSSSSVADAASSLQGSVDRLHGWGQKWRIKFEPSKSQAMTLSLHRRSWDIPTISFGGVDVPEATQLKLLGVTFDQKLSFAAHLRTVAGRANQRLGILKRAASFLDADGRAAVYRGFVRPIMEYAPLIWMGAASSHLSRLDRVQARAEKIIGASVTLPSLGSRRTMAALSYIYKLHTVTTPPQLPRILPAPLSPPRNPRTRRQHRLVHGHKYQLREDLPARTPQVLRGAFPYSCVKLWNGLPNDLLDRPPMRQRLQSFKAALWRHLSTQD